MSEVHAKESDDLQERREKADSARAAQGSAVEGEERKRKRENAEVDARRMEKEGATKLNEETKRTENTKHQASAKKTNQEEKASVVDKTKKEKETASVVDETKEKEKASVVDETKEEKKASVVDKTNEKETASVVDETKEKEKASVVDETKEEKKASVVDETKEEKKASVVDKTNEKETASVVDETKEEKKASVVDKTKQEENTSVVDETKEEEKASVVDKTNQEGQAENDEKQQDEYTRRSENDTSRKKKKKKNSVEFKVELEESDLIFENSMRRVEAMRDLVERVDEKERVNPDLWQVVEEQRILMNRELTSTLNIFEKVFENRKGMITTCNSALDRISAEMGVGAAEINVHALQVRGMLDKGHSMEMKIKDAIGRVIDTSFAKDKYDDESVKENIEKIKGMGDNLDLVQRTTAEEEKWYQMFEASMLIQLRLAGTLVKDLDLSLMPTGGAASGGGRVEMELLDGVRDSMTKYYSSFRALMSALFR